MKCPYCETTLKGIEGSRSCPHCWAYETNKDNYNLTRKERADLEAKK